MLKPSEISDLVRSEKGIASLRNLKVYRVWLNHRGHMAGNYEIVTRSKPRAEIIARKLYEKEIGHSEGIVVRDLYIIEEFRYNLFLDKTSLERRTIK